MALCIMFLALASREITTGAPNEAAAPPSIKFTEKKTLLFDSEKFKSRSSDTGKAFSPDMRHYAQIVSRQTGNFVVVDGVAGKEYPMILGKSLVFSPDGKHFAYVAGRQNKFIAVIDGAEGKEYERILGGEGDYIFFSPDSKRYAYRASSDKHQLYVVDGAEGKEYDKVIEGGPGIRLYPAWSPDSRRFAYYACQDDNWCLVVDGVESKGKGFDSIGTELIRGRGRIAAPVFSPDSQHVAGFLNRGIHTHAVIDGDEGKGYISGSAGMSAIEGFAFSPDSKHTVFIASDKGKRFVVRDGKKARECTGASNIVFSPDSQRIAYVAASTSTLPSVSPGGFWGGQRCAVFVDGVEGKRYDGIGNITFSPDSKRLAYGAWASAPAQGAAGTVQVSVCVVDGVESKNYRMERNEMNNAAVFMNGGGMFIKPIFSPDSKHVAYVALTKNGRVVVQDGAEGKEYGNVQNLTFSPDSTRLAYAAMGRQKWCVVNNGAEGNLYGGIFNLQFTSDSKHLVWAATNETGEWGSRSIVVDEVKSQGHSFWQPPPRPGESAENSPLFVLDSPASLHFLEGTREGINLVEVEFSQP